MKLWIRRICLTAALLSPAGAPAAAFADQAAAAHDPRAAETAAAEALTRLGIPLQRDPEGVVRWIEADQGQFTDEALARLPALRSLEWLEIGGGRVTPAGLAHLQNATALRRLYIHDIDLGANPLPWLSGLPNLEALALRHTGTDGAVLKHLTSKSLTVLNLSGNPVGDGAMEAVARLRQLEVLALADTKVTGAGIASLEGMPRLNELNIMRCDIRDGDLQSFLSMPNLRIVYAEGTPLGDMAVHGIVQRFPMLAIFR